MPSNHNYVCFNCRVGVRRANSSAVAPTCSACGHLCQSIGYKIPLPSKQDVRAWEILYVSLREQARAKLAAEREVSVKRLHASEREIERLRALPPNADRARRVHELQRDLAVLKLKAQ